MNLHTIQPISHFRAHTTAILEEMRETGMPIILTQNGRAAAVVVSPEEWEATQESLAMLQLLALRLDEVKHGKSSDFDSVMDEVDAMIEAHDGR